MKEIEFLGAVLKTTQYTGRKTIEAVPMRKAAAEVACGRCIPGVEGEGYLVIYPDGYMSWSPKEVFEAAYKVSETPMDRMVIEADELAEKIVKANNYLLGECRKSGTVAQRHTLDRQIKAMKEYLDILEIRKKIYEAENSEEENQGCCCCKTDNTARMPESEQGPAPEAQRTEQETENESK